MAHATTQNGNSLVISYLYLRKAIGIIAMVLPIVLVTGKFLLDGPGIQASISLYYYTEMRDVFVGFLCAIAIFLLSYRGYETKDRTAGMLACLFALGVAFFPTAPETGATVSDILIGRIHMVCAGSFFLSLAYFSLILFKKGSASPSANKLRRNLVYTVCGVIILVCLAAIVVVKTFLTQSAIMHVDPEFWLESFAIWGFGISWFIKGEGLLKDD